MKSHHPWSPIDMCQLLAREGQADGEIGADGALIK